MNVVMLNENTQIIPVIRHPRLLIAECFTELHKAQLLGFRLHTQHPRKNPILTSINKMFGYALRN